MPNLNGAIITVDTHLRLSANQVRTLFISRSTRLQAEIGRKKLTEFCQVIIIRADGFLVGFSCFARNNGLVIQEQVHLELVMHVSIYIRASPG